MRRKNRDLAVKHHELHEKARLEVEARNRELEAENRKLSERAWLEAKFHEYTALRFEILQSIQSQHACFTLGVGATGIIAAVGFNRWKDSTAFIPELIFLFLVPAVALATAAIWISEVGRMFRAAEHVRRLEKQINRFINGAGTNGQKGRALTWESQMWHKRSGIYHRLPDAQFFGQYGTTLVALCGLVFLSLGLGNWHHWNQAHPSHTLSLVFEIGEPTVGVASFLTLFWLWRSAVSKFIRSS